MPAITGVVLDGVDPHQAGTASAVFNTFRQVGGAVAIAVFGSLIAGSAWTVVAVDGDGIRACGLSVVSLGCTGSG